MEWQQLQGFRQVVRLGSFTKAAQATLRSQSAVSQQVKALEEELGCQLIERMGRQRLRITAPGEKVLAFAEEMTARLEALSSDLREFAQGETGWLRLAAPFTTLVTLFPDIVAAYHQRYPQVEITLLDRPQDRVVSAVRNAEVDMGIVLQSAAPSDLTVRRWKRVDPVLITPRDHPLTRKGEVTLEQIAQYPLLLPPGGERKGRRAMLEQALAGSGTALRVIMESSNVELSSLFVARGVGICFATVAQGVNPPQAGLAFISLNHLFPSDHLALLCRKTLRLDKHHQDFIQLLLNS